jgi:hypothetical protein
MELGSCRLHCGLSPVYAGHTRSFPAEGMVAIEPRGVKRAALRLSTSEGFAAVRISAISAISASDMPIGVRRFAARQAMRTHPPLERGGALPPARAGKLCLLGPETVKYHAVMANSSTFGQR